jgi:glycosyltransferase involved in cell wall biosynthesis
MDRANYELAWYLADEVKAEVHLVSYFVASPLAEHPQITWHKVAKPFDMYLLAEPLLDRAGRRVARELSNRGAHVLVNGGNCDWGDANWVHYVHAAYRPPHAGGPLRALKNKFAHRTFLKNEKTSLKHARVIVANSERTRQDIIKNVGVAPARVHTIYYGIDRKEFHPTSEDESARAKLNLKWTAGHAVVAFIGALGDRRKGFDQLFAAWESLCADEDWDVDLAVIGTGSELPAWKARAVSSNLEQRIHFMGFRKDVPAILAACDALVAPTRYEAYGLGVHEALCRGLPSLVSRTAGVAECYPPELADLLLDDPPKSQDIAQRLRRWRADMNGYHARVARFSEVLRQRSWTDMAREIVEKITA